MSVDETVQPEGAALVPSEPKAPVTETAPAASPPPSAPPLRPYWHRFRAMYVILALAVAAGAAGIVLAATTTVAKSSAPPWSTFKPSGGGLGAAGQIANYVAGRYHLPSGDQLTDVIARAPSVKPAKQEIPIDFVAMRGKRGRIGNVFSVNPSNAVMYSVCGLGQACSIATGKPSVERGTLVRREILELALYTFKYVHSIQHVIAFMPPTPGSQPTLAVFLDRSDLGPQLKVPLDRTLSPHVPLPATITAKEQETIDATTQSRVYKFSLSQAQNGDAVLVLAPLAA